MDVYVINLPKDHERAAFQKKQFSRLGLEFKIIDAKSINDISEKFYKSVAFNWERPLSRAEVCCYLSHRMVWQLILETNKEALVLEDDAFISSDINLILESIKDVESDYINLETRARKKVISKKHYRINDKYKLNYLYYGGTGAAGYVLRPSGADALLKNEEKYGYALADAHICRTRFNNPLQLDCAAVIQLDCCEKYMIEPPYKPVSNLIYNKKKYHIKFWFIYKLRRFISQIKQANRYIKILFPGIKRKEIKPDSKSFYLC